MNKRGAKTIKSGTDSLTKEFLTIQMRSRQPARGVKVVPNSNINYSVNYCRVQNQETGADRTLHESQHRRQRSEVVHYTSEGRRVRIHVQLAPTNEANEANLAEYIEIVGAFVIRYEGAVIGSTTSTPKTELANAETASDKSCIMSDL
jgi:hypothetical protein